MTQTRIALGVVAIVALSVACTRPDVTADTQPLAPPDSLTPQTTTSTRPHTTTTVHVDRARIYPVDPITLEAVAGFEPMPVGDWAWGTSSESGSWLALAVSRDDWNSTELQLIDVDNWAVADRWNPFIDSPTHITNDGSIYVVHSSSEPSLRRMVPGEVIPAVVADLPPHFIWYDSHFVESTALFFGIISPNDDGVGEATLVTVNLATGESTVIPLPAVDIGVIGSLETPAFGSTTFDTYPEVVWDDFSSRVLFIDANRDMVAEVDPQTGAVDDHEFGPKHLSTTPTEDGPFELGFRSAALGRPNGRVLYVASGVMTYELIDEYLTARSEGLGIEAIDTETWEVIDHLDVPIAEISLSSDGGRLMASGHFYEDNAQNQLNQSSGLYVIDAGNLEVITHHEPDQPDSYYGSLSVNPDMPIGYVQSWARATTIDVVNLDEGSMVASRSGGDIQFFAEAGVLVDTSFGNS